MYKTRTHVATLLLTLAFVACDDNTGTLGIHASGDGLSGTTEDYELTTRSLKMDSVVAYSTINYLGSITDPETQADVTADFAAQFYCFEDYKLPAREDMIGDVGGTATKGIVQCDSCEVRLYFNNYYGDADNTMKLQVYELSTTRLLEENKVYYTDTDLAGFLPDESSPLASRVFTPRDNNVDATTLNSQTYNANVCVALPQDFGQRILERYYANPAYFANSYNFIRNVFPGFYFKTSSGKGTMLSVHVGTMNIFYRYYSAEEDTIYNGVTRFAATPEVLQSTHFDNGNVDALLADNSCTYLKTPAGICTEMTLPIDQLFAGRHATDSISKATIVLTRYNKPQDDYQLGTPNELLMVRKQDMYGFFADRRVSDSRTSYTTAFNSTYNTYTFTNICRLLTYCKHEKAEARLRENESRESAGLVAYSEAEWDGIWRQRHPDWDKVVFIPVVTSNSTVTNQYGQSVVQQTSVNHDFSLGSIRLVGGDTKLKMQVVYSKFND